MKDKWKVKRLCPNTLMDMGFIFSLVCGMGSSVSCIISCFFIYHDSDTSEDEFFFFFFFQISNHMIKRSSTLTSWILFFSEMGMFIFFPLPNFLSHNKLSPASWIRVLIVIACTEELKVFFYFPIKGFIYLSYLEVAVLG